MYSVYVSPSLQKANEGVGDYGTEYDRMHQLADILSRILENRGYKVYRSDPNMTLNEAIRDSNAKMPDIHLALHSNASTSHEARGPEVIVASNGRARTLANAIYNQLRTINPYPGRGVLYDTYYGELRLTKAPANLIEVDFHDNPEGAQWIIDNMNLIAEKIADGVDEYFYGQN